MNLLQPNLKALGGGQSIATAPAPQDSPTAKDSESAELPDRPRVILAIDRPGWAFDHIAQQIEKHLGELYDFKIIPYRECQHEHADVLVAFWWRSLTQLLADNYIKKSVLCLYDHYSWLCSPYDVAAFEFAVKKVDVITTGNLEIASTLRTRGFTDKPVYLCEDGVDCDLFTPKIPPPSTLTLGWCGNAKAAHGSVKGLHLIRAAVKKARDVELKVLDVSDEEGLIIDHEHMPGWYGSLSAYVCASTHEGTPNPVLEAMASGRPVITTRCGLTPRLVVDGVNGFFCERSVDGIVAAIDRLRVTDFGSMRKAARLAAESYNWTYKIANWRMALGGALTRWL